MYQKKYFQYNVEAGKYVPMGKLDLRNNIEPNYYSCQRDMSGIYFEPIDVVLDGLIKFNDSLANKLLNNVKQFWMAKPKFDKIKKSIKLLYKRGFLLFGPPGCGKTSILSLVLKDVIDDNGIALMFSGVDLTTECIKAVRDIDPSKKIIVVIEDLDSWVRSNEEGILNMLDGIDTTFENIIFLATTNNIDKIPKRILRPSRFDFKIEMDYPVAETRRQYLEGLFNAMNFTDSNKIKAVINKMVNDTDKFSFADLKELFISTAIFEYNYDQVLGDIKNALHTEDAVRLARASKTSLIKEGTEK